MKKQNKVQHLILSDESKFSSTTLAEKFIQYIHSFKPKLFSLLLVLSITFTENLFTQTLTPPSGKIRGMYVSCGE